MKVLLTENDKISHFMQKNIVMKWIPVPSRIGMVPVKYYLSFFLERK